MAVVYLYFFFFFAYVQSSIWRQDSNPRPLGASLGINLLFNSVFQLIKIGKKLKQMSIANFLCLNLILIYTCFTIFQWRWTLIKICFNFWIKHMNSEFIAFFHTPCNSFAVMSLSSSVRVHSSDFCTIYLSPSPSLSLSLSLSEFCRLDPYLQAHLSAPIQATNKWKSCPWQSFFANGSNS